MEFFFTLYAVNSFTVGVIGLSVTLSQLGRIKKPHHSDCEPYLLLALCGLKIDLDPHQNLGFIFGLVFNENRGFGFTHCDTFFVSSSPTNPYRYCYPWTTVDWNALPASVKSRPSIHSFRCAIHYSLTNCI